MNLLTHCPMCGEAYSRAWPDAHPATDAAHELMPCACEAWHVKMNRESRARQGALGSNPDNPEEYYG